MGQSGSPLNSIPSGEYEGFTFVHPALSTTSLPCHQFYFTVIILAFKNSAFANCCHLSFVARVWRTVPLYVRGQDDQSN